MSDTEAKWQPSCIHACLLMAAGMQCMCVCYCAVQHAESQRFTLGHTMTAVSDEEAVPGMLFEFVSGQNLAGYGTGLLVMV